MISPSSWSARSMILVGRQCELAMGRIASRVFGWQATSKESGPPAYWAEFPAARPLVHLHWLVAQIDLAACRLCPVRDRHLPTGWLLVLNRLPAVLTLHFSSQHTTVTVYQKLDDDRPHWGATASQLSAPGNVLSPRWLVASAESLIIRVMEKR